MLPDILIDKDTVRKYYKLSASLDVGDLTTYIREAQNIDIENTLGNYFLGLIKNNQEITKYSLLLKGGEYTYDNKQYSFEGLNGAIACYAVARYIEFKDLNDTPFGMRVKNSDVSEMVSDKRLSSLVAAKRSEGQKYLYDVITFLDRNLTTYPEWESTCTEEINAPSGVSKLRSVNRLTGNKI